MAEENNSKPPEQRKHSKNWPPYDQGARIISYNMREEERPFGVKIRFKIRIVTGKAAAAMDRQQADAIKEYLKWVRQYRQQAGTEDSGTAGDPPQAGPQQ